MTAVDERIYVCRSGSAADTQAVSDYVTYFLDQARHPTPRDARPAPRVTCACPLSPEAGRAYSGGRLLPWSDPTD